MYSSFKELNSAIKNCNKCQLCNNKDNKVVIGRGGENIKTPIDLMIIGEASGSEEAKQGLPFVGRSGEMLSQWQKLFKIDNWVIVNVVKNRPTDGNKDRPPTDEEIKACSPYLFNQIELFKPKKILVVGKTALKTLTNEDKITKIVEEKKILDYNGIPVYTYFHPAYILRNLKQIDWQKDIEKLSELITGNKTISASSLYSVSGVKNLMLNKELKELKTLDDELSYPLIGMRTEYSLMNFGGKLEDQQKYLISHNAKSIIVADNNTTSSFLKINKLKEFGVKILYSANIIFNEYFFNLIIENQEGYKNLNKIISYVNGKTEDKNNIEFINIIKFNSNGLRLIIPSSEYNVNLEYEELINIFKKSYIGLVSHDLKSKIKADFMKRKYNLPTVIFLDNKYISKDDYDIYLTIKSIKNHSSYNDTKLYDKNTSCYIKFKSELNLNDEIIKASQQLVDEIDFKIQEYHNLLPTISNKTREEKEEEFKKLVLSKDLTEDIIKYSKKKNIKQEDAKKIYDERIETELTLINSKEFIDYFLIVKDVHDFVKDSGHQIPSGRGSVGGSLCAYCLGITQVDPLLNDLLFERFINPDRIDLPDIDCDFPSSFRPEIIKYLINKYGKDKIIPSCTILSFKELSAIGEVGKALNIPKYIIDEMKGMIIKRTSGDARSGHIIQQTIETFPQFKKYIEQYPEFFKIVEKIEGQHKAIGTHASGIMMFKDEYYNYVSLLKSNKGFVTSFEYPEMEHNGLVKLDLLGLSALDLIENVSKKNNLTVNYREPNENMLEDKKVYELIRNRYTSGIFQLSTQAMTRIGSEVITSFNDIIATNAFVRPAPIRFGVPDKYKKFKETNIPYSVGSKRADEMLKGYGFEEFGNLVLFQEQIMIIFNKIAGFYSSYSNSAIKAIAKSKGITSFFEQYGQMFIDGAIKNGYTEEEARKIFDVIYQFGSYGFNKSHATLYAHTIYYTAFLKAYYPIDFYITSYNLSNTDEKNHLVSEMITRGYKFMQPDINISDIDNLTYKDNKFYSPLSEIKYITEKQMLNIIKNRPYKDLDDLFNKIKFTDRIKNSIKESCVKSDDPEELLYGKINLPTLISNAEHLKSFIKEKYNIEISTIKEIFNNGKKEGWYLAIADDKAHYGSKGDWLPITEKPTKEQIENDKKYIDIKKWGWMRKWAKLALKDFEGTDSYTNIQPDVYDLHFNEIKEIKTGNLILVKCKLGKKLLDKQTLIDIKIFKR